MDCSYVIDEGLMMKPKGAMALVIAQQHYTVGVKNADFKKHADLIAKIVSGNAIVRPETKRYADGRVVVLFDLQYTHQIDPLNSRVCTVYFGHQVDPTGMDTTLITPGDPIVITDPYQNTTIKHCHKVQKPNDNKWYHVAMQA
jgi:hypothetical protein